VPCLAGSFDPDDGVYHTVVTMPVLPPGVVRPHQPASFKALFDTGAQVSCVSQRVALTVGLRPRGRTLFASASEVKETNLLLFNIGFIQVVRTALLSEGTSGATFVFGPLQGLEIHAAATDDVDVLVGMDVLGRGALHLSFDGRFIFSW
jgi:hypothetical protein